MSRRKNQKTIRYLIEKYKKYVTIANPLNTHCRIQNFFRDGSNQHYTVVNLFGGAGVSRFCRFNEITIISVGEPGLIIFQG